MRVALNPGMTNSSVELLRRGRPGVLATGVPTVRDLTALAYGIAGEARLDHAALRLQVGARWLMNAAEAVVSVFDAPRRAAWSLTGPIHNPSVVALIAQVATAGQRSVIGNALLEPIGTRIVLAVRKSAGGQFTPSELAMMGALSTHIAPWLERLLA